MEDDGTRRRRAAARCPRIRVGLARVVLPIFILLLISSIVMITVISSTYANRTASRLSRFYLEQVGHRIEARYQDLQNATERATASLGARILRSTGGRAMSSADFGAIANLALDAFSEGAGHHFNLFGMTLPNREQLLLRRESPEAFLAQWPRAAYPVSMLSWRINASLPDSAPGRPAVDRFTSYLDRETGRWVVFERAPNVPVDFRLRPYVVSAKETKAPLWSPAFPFNASILGAAQFVHVAPLYTGAPWTAPDLPGALGETLPPEIPPYAPPPGSVYRGAIALTLQGLRQYVTNVKVAESGFAALVANDIASGAPRAVAYKRAGAIVRPVPADPVAGTNLAFVETEQLADPELKAFMEAMPQRLSELPLPPPAEAGLQFEPSEGPAAPFMQEMEFKVGGREYVGRWRKLAGQPGGAPNATMQARPPARDRCNFPRSTATRRARSSSSGSPPPSPVRAAPRGLCEGGGAEEGRAEIEGDVARLEAATIAISAACGGLALLLGAATVLEATSPPAPAPGPGPLTVGQVRRAMGRLRGELDAMAFFSLDPDAPGPPPVAPAATPPAPPSGLAGFFARRGSVGRRRRASHADPEAPAGPALAPGGPLLSQAPHGAGRGRLRSPISELDEVGEALAKMQQAVQVPAPAPATPRPAPPPTATRQLTSTISDALLVVDARGGSSTLPALRSPARAPDGAAGAVVHSNAAARALFFAGGGGAGLAGPARMPVMSLVAPADRPALAGFLAAEQAPGATIECSALALGDPVPGAPEGGAGRAFPVELSVGRMELRDQTLQVLVVRDVSERKAMEGALQRSEAAARVTSEDLRRIIDTANAPIFNVDPALRVTAWNRAAARVTGIQPGRSWGGTCWSWWRSGTASAPSSSSPAGSNASSSGGSQPLSSLASSALSQGARRLVRLLVSATARPAPPAHPAHPAPPPARARGRRRDAHGRVVGAVAVGQDMTEQRARIEAEAINETRNRFLAYTVHELRTPLNGVLGMGELLGETRLDGEQRELAHAIRISAEQMLVIVNECARARPRASSRERTPWPSQTSLRPGPRRSLLDLHKIEAGRIVLEAIPFDLRAVVEDTVEAVAPAAFEKGVEIAAYLPCEGAAAGPGEAAIPIPARLLGDPCRVKQIITNLAFNGVKFTQRGHVLVRVAAVRALPAAILLRIEVEDTGLGIDESGLERIFQDYVQADQSITRLYGGTGMGEPFAVPASRRASGA
eukprot:tig00000893_g5345.t1